jgi:hypothetical protein
MNVGPNYGTRAVVVVLGGLCMPHVRFIWANGHYTTPNCHNGRLLACLLLDLAGDRTHTHEFTRS